LQIVHLYELFMSQ